MMFRESAVRPFAAKFCKERCVHLQTILCLCESRERILTESITRLRRVFGAWAPLLAHPAGLLQTAAVVRVAQQVSVTPSTQRGLFLQNSHLAFLRSLFINLLSKHVRDLLVALLPQQYWLLKSLVFCIS